MDFQRCITSAREVCKALFHQLTWRQWLRCVALGVLGTFAFISLVLFGVALNRSYPKPQSALVFLLATVAASLLARSGYRYFCVVEWTEKHTQTVYWLNTTTVEDFPQWRNTVTWTLPQWGDSQSPLLKPVLYCVAVSVTFLTWCAHLVWNFTHFVVLWSWHGLRVLLRLFKGTQSEFLIESTVTAVVTILFTMLLAYFAIMGKLDRQAVAEKMLSGVFPMPEDRADAVCMSIGCPAEVTWSVFLFLFGLSGCALLIFAAVRAGRTVVVFESSQAKVEKGGRGKTKKVDEEKGEMPPHTRGERERGVSSGGGVEIEPDVGVVENPLERLEEGRPPPEEDGASGWEINDEMDDRSEEDEEIEAEVARGALFEWKLRERTEAAERRRKEADEEEEAKNWSFKASDFEEGDRDRDRDSLSLSPRESPRLPFENGLTFSFRPPPRTPNQKLQQSNAASLKTPPRRQISKTHSSPQQMMTTSERIQREMCKAPPRVPSCPQHFIIAHRSPGESPDEDADLHLQQLYYLDEEQLSPSFHSKPLNLNIDKHARQKNQQQEVPKPLPQRHPYQQAKQMLPQQVGEEAWRAEMMNMNNKQPPARVPLPARARKSQALPVGVFGVDAQGPMSPSSPPNPLHYPTQQPLSGPSVVTQTHNFFPSPAFDQHTQGRYQLESMRGVGAP
uniref:Uncharacterized protein n=1 Tax=Chromera velia CCMP2878 TaxID=1169474 RepID=A0A0G4GG10_9ALVE|eukprot:Cvel_21727.t1-p1 / transcript=Cvel_21727.t1 / gene=Cvel_21727 / organism=Chromera_velia_CCMP2878 / gene_product=hypothetical protein / transcript_product=hypothetical protein / location=Cvel_scaffold2062:18562-21367(+) / protein_length=674 / sequence_SO=supercontig / SO=protein_coding / is_pseudo=false